MVTLHTAKLDTKVSAILYVQFMCIFCEARIETLCIIWISVFQSGFHEGTLGVPRKTDKCLGILYVVFFIFIDLYLNIIKL